MKILESAENYLETILMLKKEKGQVRAIDIVNHLGYSKPSVSVAMKNLRQNGLILVDNSGYITLTEEGQSIANNILERHHVISSLLIGLGVDPEVAAEDACKIEHVLSPESFEALKNHSQNFIKE